MHTKVCNVKTCERDCGTRDLDHGIIPGFRFIAAMSLFVFMYLVGMAVVLYVCGMAGYWILQPIANAVKGRRRPTRYSMVDFLWLSIMVTVSLAPLGNIVSSWEMDVGRFDRSYYNLIIGIIAVMILVVIAIVWWRGIATLSGLGIDDHRRRGTFLMVVVPASIAISLFAVPAMMFSLVSAFNGEGREVLFWFTTVGVMVPAVYVARRLCLWVLSGAKELDVALGSTDDPLAVEAAAE